MEPNHGPQGFWNPPPPSYLTWGSEALGVVLYPAGVVTRLLDMDCGIWRGDRGRISFSNVHLRKSRLLCVTKGGMEGQTHLLSPGLADVFTELVLSVRAWVVWYVSVCTLSCRGQHPVGLCPLQHGDSLAPRKPSLRFVWESCGYLG